MGVVNPTRTYIVRAIFSDKALIKKIAIQNAFPFWEAGTNKNIIAFQS